MKNLILTALLSIMLLGCITEKKQRFNAEQFYRQHPEELALNCAEKFPIKTELIQGEETIRVDTVYRQNIIMDCPEVYDTLTHTSYTPKVVCPDQKIITIEKKTVNTLVKENTAKVEAYRLKFDISQKDLKLANYKAELLQEDNKKQGRNIIILLVLLVISMFFHVKKFFTPRVV